MSRFYVGPYINFQGRAREAMELYQQVLGGKLDLQSATDQGAPKPAGPGDRIMHARLDADGVVVIGTDGHPKYPPTVGDNWAVAVGGTDKARLTKIFNDLGAGGTIKGPLTEAPGGEVMGWLTDKFGVNWTVGIDTA